MEGNDIVLQSSYRGNTRPTFVPRQPPRRRLRGALPRPDEQEQGFIAEHPRASQTILSRKPGTEHTIPSRPECVPEDQRDTHLPNIETQAPSIHSVQGAPMQNAFSLQPRGCFTRGQNPAHWRNNFTPGAANFSRSWHRVSIHEQQHQKDATLLHHSAPSLPFNGASPLSPGLPHAAPLMAQDPRTSYPFLETRSSFEGMWHQLEAAIQRREGMLVNMKAEMEKAFSVVKNAKVDAMKEKEEVEARNAEVMENIEDINKQTGRIKCVREGMEQISTDLSVQVAELNLMLQQVQEQQRILELLESLSEHYDAPENEKSNFMDRSLQECEVKLATMEKELNCSKRTSERLEKAALKSISDLEEIEAGCKTNAERNQTLSKAQTLERQPGLNEGQKLSEHGAVLKLPKLEPTS